MKFNINRETVLKPLQLAANVAEKRQTLPILSNLLLVLKNQSLHVTATDSEVEMVCHLSLDEPAESGSITVPARKMLDICRNLPTSAVITCELKKERMTVKSGRTRFTLSTLPAADFPHFSDGPGQREFHVSSVVLKSMIEQTQFAMAQQDVRYYLNGLLLEVTAENTLQAVATDGHRLAKSSASLSQPVEPIQAIVPRKGIVELSRLLADSDEQCLVTIGDNFIRISSGYFIFTSKLVDGRFPDIQRKLPKTGDLVVTTSRDGLKQTLQRAAILTNEKYHGVRLQLAENSLTVLANNPEQEEAEEELDVAYSGKSLEVGFNVTYLLDALSALPEGEVELAIVDGNNSALIRSLSAREDNPAAVESLYVVMPMRV